VTRTGLGLTTGAYQQMPHLEDVEFHKVNLVSDVQPMRVSVSQQQKNHK
jgi:hypothetical protein